MQAASDIFLGWCANEDADGGRRDFYVRQLWDQKGSIDVDAMRPRAMEIYAGLCGWTLARAHARSGDPVAIGAYLGSGDVFDQAVAEFSAAYADQNERDHAALRAAIESGRIEAVDA
jgi:sugar/nucleoside kinase (ribokinase family)